MDFRRFFTQDELNIQQTLLSFEEALIPYFDEVAVFYVDNRQFYVAVKKYGFIEGDWIYISQIIWAKDWFEMTLNRMEELRKRRAELINARAESSTANLDFTSSKTPGG